jgi:acetyl esterase/lipase
MLSGNAATHYDSGDSASVDEIERQSCRPDAAVICYGAFAFSTYPQGMLGFFHNPFADTKEDLYYLAPEANVTPDTPPMFIWQTNSDDPRHSFALGAALQQANVKFEMHLFPQGEHGMSLADGENDLSLNIPHVAKWADMCAEWLTEIGI